MDANEAHQRLDRIEQRVTIIAEENARLNRLLETARARIRDMLAADDGQAFKEARKFLETS